MYLSNIYSTIISGCCPIHIIYSIIQLIFGLFIRHDWPVKPPYKPQTSTCVSWNLQEHLSSFGGRCPWCSCFHQRFSFHTHFISSTLKLPLLSIATLINTTAIWFLSSTIFSGSFASTFQRVFITDSCTLSKPLGWASQCSSLESYILLLAYPIQSDSERLWSEPLRCLSVCLATGSSHIVPLLL